MTNEPPISKKQATSWGKRAVELMGFGLGNLMYRLHNGNFHKAGDDWTDEDRTRVRGTVTFLLGGSICTSGYMSKLLPRYAMRQIRKRDAELASRIQIVTSPMASAETGAFGAYYLALPPAVRDDVSAQAKKAASSHKTAILPLLDIGGTKVRFVLAYVTPEGPSFEVLQSYLFPTPKCSPREFYQALATVITPTVRRIADSGFTSLIPILAVGQPGRFDEPKGLIGPGTAQDLGSDFPGIYPSELFQQALAEEKHRIDLDVYFANDGRCQFVGVGAVQKARRPEGWKTLTHQQVAYLGIGTGLGSGFGEIGEDGLIVPNDIVSAFNTIADDPEHEQLDWPEEIRDDFPVSYKYGSLLSGKFFRRFMHKVDLARLGGPPENPGRKIVPGGPIFIGHSSAKLLTPEQQLSLVRGDEPSSPLNGLWLNELLDGETIGDETQELVESQRAELEQKLNETLKTIAAELDGTLLNNVRDCQYEAVIDEVVRTKRRGRHVQFMGIGKCHSIGRNLAYIFSNLGIDSTSCELTGADSENLTHIHEEDMIFVISNSGRTAELLQILPHLKKKHCCTVALTGNPESPIAQMCQHVINAHVKNNPSRIEEAPTTSTTAALAAGAAIGIVVSFLFDYDAREFFLDHPNLEFRVPYPEDGVRADASFDKLARIEDILRRFANAIRALAENEPEFTPNMISLTKRILVAHWNQRPVFFTGSGASLRAAEKIAATLTSIGIDAEAVNPAQLPHGDFAHIDPHDLLVLISYSGETRHLIQIQALACKKGIDCATITSNGESTMAKACDPGLRVIAGSKVNDIDLVPIPDQKILSSFLNLTVGDTLAVILAEIIGTSDEQFAQQAHQYGGPGRKAGRLKEELVRSLGPVLAREISSNPDRLAKINEDLQIPVRAEHLTQFVHRRMLAQGGGARDVMIFGMGAIGLAYLAPMIREQNRMIWFVEKELSRIQAMRRCGNGYAVRQGSHTRRISMFDMIPQGEGAAREHLLQTSLLVNTILTAVGANAVWDLLPALREIVLMRYQFRIDEPLNIVLCENFAVREDPLAELRHTLREGLATPDLKAYFDVSVGLVLGVDESQVPEVPEEAFSKVIDIESPPAVLYVDQRQWHGGGAGRNGQGHPEFGTVVQGTTSLWPLHMRKLWVHNMAHAMIGYLGAVAGYERVCEAVADPRIEQITTDAMLTVAGELYRRWSYRESGQTTAAEYVGWRWSRYNNAALCDTVARLCRDPYRKLEPEDRLLGAINYVRRYASPEGRDEKLTNLLIGVAAAIRYAEPHDRTRRDELRAKVLGRLPNIDSKLLVEAERRLAERFAAGSVAAVV